jgi:hypothetical protein
MMRKISIALCLVLAAAALAGCQNNSRAANGALLGGTAGALIGGGASGSWGGAAVGAGVGAVTGAVIADATGRCYWTDNQGRRHRTSCR